MPACKIRVDNCLVTSRLGRATPSPLPRQYCRLVGGLNPHLTDPGYWPANVTASAEQEPNRDAVPVIGGGSRSTESLEFFVARITLVKDLEHDS